MYKTFNPSEVRKAGTFNPDEGPAYRNKKDCVEKQGLDAGSTSGPYIQNAGGKPTKRGDTKEGLNDAYDMSLQKVYPKKH